MRRKILSIIILLCLSLPLTSCISIARKIIGEEAAEQPVSLYVQTTGGKRLSYMKVQIKYGDITETRTTGSEGCLSVLLPAGCTTFSITYLMDVPRGLALISETQEYNLEDIATDDGYAAIYELQATCRIRISAVDGETTEPISGATYFVFTNLETREPITDINGVVQEGLTTGDDGTVTTGELLPGQYYVGEQNVPAGHKKAGIRYTITVPETATGEVTFSLAKEDN